MVLTRALIQRRTLRMNNVEDIGTSFYNEVYLPVQREIAVRADIRNAIEWDRTMANELRPHPHRRCTVGGCPNPQVFGRITCSVHARPIFGDEPDTALPSWSWRDLAALAVGGALLWVLVGYAVYTVWNIPTVTQSYSTGECLHVTSPYDCVNMPVKFHHVWGK